jgi:hypothetical protein
MHASRLNIAGASVTCQSGSPPGLTTINSFSGTESLSPDWFFNSPIGRLSPAPADREVSRLGGEIFFFVIRGSGHGIPGHHAQPQLLL